MTGQALGLCSDCLHARRVESARGSTFLRCSLHDTDLRFAKYPRLPVMACPGFAARDAVAQESER